MSLRPAQPSPDSRWGRWPQTKPRGDRLSLRRPASSPTPICAPSRQAPSSRCPRPARPNPRRSSPGRRPSSAPAPRRRSRFRRRAAPRSPWKPPSASMAASAISRSCVAPRRSPSFWQRPCRSPPRRRRCGRSFRPGGGGGRRTTRRVEGAGRTGRRSPGASRRHTQSMTRDETGIATVRAIRVRGDFALDGTLDRGGSTPRCSRLRTSCSRSPAKAQPATEKTEVWLFYDDENIYVGARLHETDPTPPGDERDAPRLVQHLQQRPPRGPVRHLQRPPQRLRVRGQPPRRHVRLDRHQRTAQPQLERPVVVEGGRTSTAAGPSRCASPSARSASRKAATSGA